MTIREMCDSFGVTPRTLRYYEQIELLSPLRDGNRRLYARRERARLKLILQGKRFGFKLEDIRKLLELYELGDQQRTQLRRTLEIAAERLRDLERRRDDLNDAIVELRDQMGTVERLLNASPHAHDPPG
jgi:DNA-binding transcriptional MerR regulator